MIGYPLDSRVEYDDNGIPVYDRAVSSAPLRKLYNKLFSDGVLPNPSNNMQVSAGDGMNVIVAPGFAMCNGCMKLEEAQRTLAVQASSAAYDRIDTVVLRLNDNDNDRICDFYIVQGIPGANPVRPELTRTESIWEIGLADLFINKNSTVISNQRITDTRYETSRCGVMSSISEFDTTTLYQQVQADLAGFKTEEQADFAAWFEEMKGQLSEDAAGNLQNQIGFNDISDIGDGTVTGAIVAQNEEMANLKKSVSDGKTLVANAITAQGVSTAADASFDTMAKNVTTAGNNRYNAGVAATKKGTAKAAQVLRGYTFTNASGINLSGDMPVRGAWTGATTGSGNVTIPAGWHSGAGYVSGAGAYNAGVAYAKSIIGAGDGYAFHNVNYSGTAYVSDSFKSSRTGICFVSIVGDHGHNAQESHGLSYSVTRNGAVINPFQNAVSSYQQTLGFAFPVNAGDTIAISASYANVGGDTQMVNVVRAVAGW